MNRRGKRRTSVGPDDVLQLKRTKCDEGRRSSQRRQSQVVTLLVLTDPCIVAKIIQLIPCGTQGIHSAPSHLLRSVVALCRAMASFDRSFPMYFRPDNNAFWGEMVLQRFDFSTSEGPNHTGKSGLALWPKLGVWYRPSEYGFLTLHQLQNVDRTTWSSSENAFSLYCDLTLLTEKMSRFVSTENNSVCHLRCCVLKIGPPDPQTQSTIHLPRGVRQSRRSDLRNLIIKHLKSWSGAYSKSHETQRKQRLYGGRSLHSDRWLGYIHSDHNM